MTAKTKHGFHGGSHTKGADHGTTHEKLLRRHRQPGRSEGAMNLNAHGPGPVSSAAPASPFQMSGPETAGEIPGMPGDEGMSPGGDAGGPAGGDPNEAADDAV